MSGGSFNYLCTKEPAELMGDTYELERMAKALSELGYADDAAKEAMDLLLLCRKSNGKIREMMDDLYVVFHGMEWWRSWDRGEEDFKEALRLYRAQ